MSNKKSRFSNALEVPKDADEFVQGAERRSKAHAKTATESMVSTSLRMNKETHRRLKIASVMYETSLTELVDRAVNELLSKLDNQELDVETHTEDGI
jgi:hypothetical protein